MRNADTPTHPAAIALKPLFLNPRGGPDDGHVVVIDRTTLEGLVRSDLTKWSHGAGGVRIIPDARMKEYQRPKKSIARVKNHAHDWLDAIRNGTKAASDFSYGAPLTQIAMLGVIAIKMRGVKLHWDAQQMRFTNSPEANLLVQPAYRDGW